MSSSVLPLSRLSRCVTAIGLALAAAPPGSAVAQTAVGVTGAVNPATTGEPPGLPVRTLVLGNDVFFNETIRTQTEGQAQLVFLDRSSLNVGPSSEIVIDEFVYDKEAGTGRLVASAAKGVFRYVGGAISKNADAVALKTPTATIGIRGGVALVSVAPEGGTTVTFLYGKAVTVSSSGGTVQLVRPGFATTVGSQGAAPSTPVQVPSAQLASAMAQLDGRAGATGGASEAPSPVLVQRSGFAESNSANVTQSTSDASRAERAAPPQAPSNNAAAPAQAQQAQTTNQQTAAETQPVFPPFVLDFLLARNFTTSEELMQPQDINGELLLDLARSGAFGSLPSSGTRAPEGEGPPTGVATYSGPLVAAVSNAGVRSISRGTFSGRVDFTRQTADFTLTNVGGRTFTGGGSTVGNAIGFTGGGDTVGVILGDTYRGADGRLAQTLFGDFFIKPAPSGSLMPAAPSAPAAEDPNGFYATGFFDATQTSFNDPFASLTAYLVQNVDLTPTFPNGPVTPSVNMPTTGTVTYTGSAIGAVSTGGPPSSASGSYTGTFDFGSRAGTVAITGFAGQTFTGSVSLGRESSFNGPLGNGIATGSIRGQFHDNGGVPAGQQAGVFAVQGASYLATGNFIGTR